MEEEPGHSALGRGRLTLPQGVQGGRRGSPATPPGKALSGRPQFTGLGQLNSNKKGRYLTSTSTFVISPYRICWVPSPQWRQGVLHAVVVGKLGSGLSHRQPPGG